MIGLSSKIQKISCLGSILAEEIIGGHAIASSIADYSNIASFNIDIPQLVMTSNTLNKRHLRQIAIHHQLLLSIFRVLLNFYLCVIGKKFIIVGEYQWINLHNICVSLDK